MPTSTIPSKSLLVVSPSSSSASANIESPVVPRLLRAIIHIHLKASVTCINRKFPSLACFRFFRFSSCIVSVNKVHSILSLLSCLSLICRFLLCYVESPAHAYAIAFVFAPSLATGLTSLGPQIVPRE
ncbi:hypothetical protein V6N11_013983 [Hibiscus sabdariffa]|uniref:Uncharacterized protein n=1 Tax=Hibiscus sabdariffa TaxID=183260 RepID=A0ABR2AG91_9ROSI